MKIHGQELVSILHHLPGERKSCIFSKIMELYIA